MRTSGRGLADRSRHRKHLAALLEGPRGRDQGAASLTCLNDDDTDREPCDDPVPLRKGPRPGILSVRELSDYDPPLRDLLAEPGVLGWVYAIEPRTENGDRNPTGIERTLVRRRVYPPGEAAHNGNPPRDEFSRQPSGVCQPTWRGPPCSDYRDRRHSSLKHKPAHEEANGRRVYLSEKLRVAAGSRHHEPCPTSIYHIELRARSGTARALRDRSRNAVGRPRCRRHNRCERTKTRSEPRRRYSTNTIRQKNCQSSFPFIHPTTPVPTSLLRQRINLIDEGTDHALEFLEPNACR